MSSGEPGSVIRVENMTEMAMTPERVEQASRLLRQRTQFKQRAAIIEEAANGHDSWVIVNSPSGNTYVPKTMMDKAILHTILAAVQCEIDAIEGHLLEMGVTLDAEQ